MIQKIAHRVSNITQILSLPKDWGLEFDVHAYKDRLVVNHDAFQSGCFIEDFIIHASGRFLAVNVKEEGIENKIINTLSSMNFKDYFLFDVNFPQVVRLSEEHSENLALRVSQLEKLDFKKCRKYASYLWIDTFDGTFWPSKDFLAELKSLSYKLCFVSPELHRPPLGDANKYLENLLNYQNLLDNEDFICTKFHT